MMDMDNDGVKKVTVTKTFYESIQNDRWTAMDRLAEAQKALRQAQEDLRRAENSVAYYDKHLAKMVVEEDS